MKQVCATMGAILAGCSPATAVIARRALMDCNDLAPEPEDDPSTNGRRSRSRDESTPSSPRQIRIINFYRSAYRRGWGLVVSLRDMIGVFSCGLRLIMARMSP